MLQMRTKKLTSLVMALIMALGITVAGSVPVNAVAVEENIIDTAGESKVLISEEQMESYKLIDRTVRAEGLIGFTDEYALDGNDKVSVIVEFVQQPPLIQMAEAEVNGLAPISMGSARNIALDAHTQFRMELNELMNSSDSEVHSSPRSVSAAGAGYEITNEYYDALNGVALTISADKVEELAQLDSVWAVYPNTIVQVDPIAEVYAVDTDATGASSSSGMKESRDYLDIAALHERGLDGEGIIVGVIDTGVDYNHPSFDGAFATSLPKAGSSLEPINGKYYGRNFVEKDPTQPIFSYITPQADNDPMETTYEEFISGGASSLTNNGIPVTWGEYVTAHGSHVAGTILGRGGDDPASSVLGIAPKATLISYRVLGPFGAGYTSWALEALDHVFEDGCDIVNMSLGVTENRPDYATSLAVNNLIVAHDIVFAISAGNDGPAIGSMGAPGTSSLAITVGNSYLPVANNELVINYNNADIVLRQLTSNGETTFVPVYDQYSSRNRVTISGGKIKYSPDYGMHGYYQVIPLKNTTSVTDSSYTYLTKSATGNYAYGFTLGLGTEADFEAMMEEYGTQKTELNGAVVLVGRGLPFIEVAERANRYGFGMVIMLDYPLGGNQPDSFFEVSKDYAPVFLVRDHWNGKTTTNLNSFTWLTSFLSGYDWNFRPLNMVAGTVSFLNFKNDLTPVTQNSNSSTGPVGGTMDIKPDVSAPGSNILSSVPYFVTAADKTNPNAPGAYDGALMRMSGTSMSSPHIAGIAALMLQHSNKQWSSAEVKARMMNTADPIGGGYSVYEIGAGFVNPTAAIDTEAFVTVAYNDVYLPNQSGSLSNARGSGEISSFNFRSVMVNQDREQAIELLAKITNTASTKTFNVRYEMNETGFITSNGESMIADRNKWDSSGVKIIYPGEITVGAGASREFSVSAFVPSYVDNTHTGIYEGYVILENSEDAGEVYRLPFSIYLRPESQIGQLFLNHPVITTSGVFFSDTDPRTGQYAPGIYTTTDANDLVHTTASFYSSLYYELGEPGSNMYFFIAPGDIDDIYDTEQYLGETGIELKVTNSNPGVLYRAFNLFGPAYFEYEYDDNGELFVNPLKMTVLTPGHYKLIAMVITPFGATLEATDLYVDNTAPQLTAQGLAGNTYTYRGGSRDEVTITGNIYDEGIAAMQELGIDYKIYEETDPHGPKPDQALNAIFARVKGAPTGVAGDVYSQAVIQPNGDFELKLTGLNVDGYTEIDLYYFDHFATINYENITNAIIMYEFDPAYPCMVKTFGYPFAFVGANMRHKTVTVVQTGPAIVLNMQKAVRYQGGSLGLVPHLNQQAIDLGYGASIEWESSDPRVVTVDNDGIVTVVDWGTAVVTARTMDSQGNEIYAGCTVYVPGNHDGVEINPFNNIFFGQYEYSKYPFESNDMNAVIKEDEKPFSLAIQGPDKMVYDPVKQSYTYSAYYIGEHARIPMMWDYKGEEIQDGLGDRMLTLMSSYNLTTMDYNADGGWTPYGDSDLNAYLNNEFISEAFSGAEQSAIPEYTVVSGEFDASGNQVGEEVLENQRAYVPWGIPGSTGGKFGNYVFWSASSDLDFDQSLKGASSWKNHRRSRDYSTLQWASYYLRNKSPNSNEVLYSKGYESQVRSTDNWKYYGTPLNWLWVAGFGGYGESEIGYAVTPLIKLDLNSILGVYDPVPSGTGGRALNEARLYFKIEETVSYKLAVMGGNDGEEVGTLDGITTEPQSISTNSNLTLNVIPSKYGSKTVNDYVTDPSYQSYSTYTTENYVIAYKVVGGEPGLRKTVISGEVTAANAGVHNLNLGTFSAGDYVVYVWLMNKCDRSSYEVGKVYSFPLYVSDQVESPAPIIDRQPHDVVTGLNVTADMNVIANISGSTSELSYQWFSCDNKAGYNPVRIENATDRVYQFTSSEAGVYYFFVEVTSTIPGKDDTVLRSDVASVTVAKDVYTVTFDLNGGTSVAIAPITAEEGDTITFPADPVRAEDDSYIYAFNGWFTERTNGTEFTADTPVTANITLYAQWRIVETKYAIKITSVDTGNGQAIINFDIASANGKGYTVYRSATGENGQFAVYSNVNYNSKGAHIKGLTNGQTNWFYVEYNDGGGNIIRSGVVEITANK